ncbi:MAG TPA: DUF3000 domain-containing protein [Actinotalea sp.]|nr:DUF3000 domain-containing protein [Actinotalea sp.]
MTADADVPAPFLLALRALRDRRLRGEVQLTEVPAPARIAPYSVALSAEVGADQAAEELGSGRFVLLHDPSGQEAWQGTFRAVTLVRAAVEPDLGGDPLLCEAAWSWVTDALTGLDVPHRALGGTVTRVVSQSFGTLEDRPTQVEVEIRASWTPDGDLGEHLGAWATLLCTAAGLPPVPDGVTALGRRR